MSEAMLGRKLSPETRKKISETKLARGASTKPKSIHVWLTRNYPKTGVCERCGARGKTNYASINGHRYTRERADYAELCPGCHLKLDYANGQRKSQVGIPKPRR